MPPLASALANSVAEPMAASLTKKDSVPVLWNRCMGRHSCKGPAFGIIFVVAIFLVVYFYYMCGCHSRTKNISNTSYSSTTVQVASEYERPIIAPIEVVPPPVYPVRINSPEINQTYIFNNISGHARSSRRHNNTPTDGTPDCGPGVRAPTPPPPPSFPPPIYSVV